jgi:hypothetical protein
VRWACGRVDFHVGNKFFRDLIKIRIYISTYFSNAVVKSTLPSAHLLSLLLLILLLLPILLL